MNFIVITSINEPTQAVLEFAEVLDQQTIVVADLKTPKNWQVKSSRIQFLSVDDQTKLNFSLNSLLPFNHYTRKMLGYLFAVKQGANSIIDTDDDNFPDSNFVFPATSGIYETTKADLGWINAYKYFTQEHIWPRGLPLDKIRSEFNNVVQSEESQIGIWQSLADGDSDVDAIYRFVFDKHIKFSSGRSIVLGEGTYSPFNSQSTKFSKPAFPLLYLPSTVTFRFTDILRGIVAQPILHCLNLRLGFTSPIFHQVRNAHDYLRDFESEVPMYLNSARALEIVSNSVSEQNSLNANLIAAYTGLAKAEIVEESELNILNSWLNDLGELHAFN
jgi:hypothetical protein